MGTSHSKGKRAKYARGNLKRSPIKTTGDNDSQNYSSRKRKPKLGKGGHFTQDETKIYSKIGEDSLRVGELDLEGGSMTVMNTKSELSVKSTKTHKTPLAKTRNKSPIDGGEHKKMRAEAD